MLKHLILLLFCFVIHRAISQKVIITPHLNVDIKKDTCIIYCSTFQIAWNELKKTIKKDVELSRKSQLVTNLNNGVDAQKYINASACAVFSGFATKKFINKINRKIKRKFHSEFNPITDTPNKNDYLFFAYIYKNLHFKKIFESLTNGLNFTTDSTRFNNNKFTNVEGFGVNRFVYDNKKNEKVRMKLLNQMKAYVSSDYKQYLVKIKTKEKDEIILARLSPKMTLSEAIDTINVLEKKLSSLDYYRICSVGIPDLNFDLDKNYQELIGATIINSNIPEITKIIEANQYTLFQINKQGAIIKSRAKIKTTKSCSFDPKYNCEILFFAEPYYLIIKKHGCKYPYLALWIANDSFMTKRK